jgi:hypothetical protein
MLRSEPTGNLFHSRLLRNLQLLADGEALGGAEAVGLLDGVDASEGALQ